jgi:hypothetical protein
MQDVDTKSCPKCGNVTTLDVSACPKCQYVFAIVHRSVPAPGALLTPQGVTARASSPASTSSLQPASTQADGAKPTERHEAATMLFTAQPNDRFEWIVSWIVHWIWVFIGTVMMTYYTVLVVRATNPSFIALIYTFAPLAAFASLAVVCLVRLRRLYIFAMADGLVTVFPSLWLAPAGVLIIVTLILFFQTSGAMQNYNQLPIPSFFWR